MRKEKIQLLLPAVLISALLPAIAITAEQRDNWTQFAHLNRLYEEIRLDGRPAGVIHIYSEYPDYGWVVAAGEGFACVDDAARAAVVYLRDFELHGNRSSLARAEKLLGFCEFMQADDGLFYNFIFADTLDGKPHYRINTTGRTSLKSLGWWTARGVWALGEAARVLRQTAPALAQQYAARVRRVFVHLDTLLQHDGEIAHYNGAPEPRWLLYNGAADATSELLLGLAAYAEATGDTAAHRYLRRFGAGLLAMQLDTRAGDYTGLFLSWRNVWHGWGNGQTQALAAAGRLLHEARFLEAGRREVQNFYPRWLEMESPREIRFAFGDQIVAGEIDPFDQIAYAVRPMVVGALRLSEAIGDTLFARQAGELAAWFLGRNPMRQQMYDPATGRCFDGILSSGELNRNAGAESTIEALYTMLEVEANPVARRVLLAWWEAHRKQVRSVALIRQAAAREAEARR